MKPQCGQHNDKIVIKDKENIFETEATLDPGSSSGEKNGTLKFSELTPSEADSIIANSPLEGAEDVVINALDAVIVTATRLKDQLLES